MKLQVLFSISNCRGPIQSSPSLLRVLFVLLWLRIRAPSSHGSLFIIFLESFCFCIFNMSLFFASASATFATRRVRRSIAVRSRMSPSPSSRSTVARSESTAKTSATSPSSSLTTNMSSIRNPNSRFFFDLLSKLCLFCLTIVRYDTSPFHFYVLTEVDEQGCHFVAYFSKAYLLFSF